MACALGAPWAVRVHTPPPEATVCGRQVRRRTGTLAVRATTEGGQQQPPPEPPYQKRWAQIQRLKRRGRRRSGTVSPDAPADAPPGGSPLGRGGGKALRAPGDGGRGGKAPSQFDSGTRAKGLRLYSRRDSESFLVARGVSAADVSAAAARCPDLLFTPVHDGLDSAWDALAACGVSPENVVRVYPAVLTLPPPILRRRLATLRAVFDDSPQMFELLVCDVPEILCRQDLDGELVRDRLQALGRVLGSPRSLATALRRSQGRFLSPGFDAGDALAELINLFGGAEDVARQALRRDPRLLGTRKGSVAETVTFLGGRGIDAVALIRRQPTLASMSATRIAAKMFWLESAVGQEAACSAVRRTPSILLASLEGQLKPVLRYLIEIGVDPAAVAKKAPTVLTRSVSGHLVPLCAYLEGLLGDLEVARKFPALLAYGLDSKLKPNADFLAARGLNVSKIVRKHPPVLAYSADANMAPKLDYLEEVMGRDVGQVNALPQYLGYSLHARIVPRHTFLCKLGADAYSLSAMLTPSDADFAENILKVTAEEYAAHVRMHKELAGVAVG